MMPLKFCLLLGFALTCVIMDRTLVAAARLKQRQYDCAAQIIVTKVVSIEPVYINTFVQENTVFALNNHFFVTVTNAPTSLDEILTYSNTMFITGARRAYSNVVYVRCSLYLSNRLLMFAVLLRSFPTSTVIPSY